MQAEMDFICGMTAAGSSSANITSAKPQRPGKGKAKVNKFKFDELESV